MSMIVQFMLESLLLVAVAMILALILVGLCIGVFNNIQVKASALKICFRQDLLLSFILVGLVAGLDFRDISCSLSVFI